MAEFKTYNFKNVDFIFGIHEITGFGEGNDPVKITLLEDQFRDIAGAKGDVVRTQTNDNRCTIELKLLQTSLSNSILMSIYNIDKASGTGVFPLTINNKEDGEYFTILQAWIVKSPDVTRGQDANSMLWTFRGNEIIANIINA